MALWFVLALMTVAAVFAVLWPLARHAGPAASGSEAAVYRDQLSELARDQKHGLIAPGEAEAARVEIARRLLRAADAPEEKFAAASLRRRRAMALVALLLLPLGTAAFYLKLGAPMLESAAPRPRGALSERSIEAMVAQIEKHLAGHPEDGRGWDVVAPVYMQLGRFEDALQARRNALRFLGRDAQREADLGEALVAVANGVVTAEAKDALQKAASLDPNNIKAQFYLGLAAQQDGDKTQAERLWRALLAREEVSRPENASWKDEIMRALSRLNSASDTAKPGGGQ